MKSHLVWSLSFSLVIRSEIISDIVIYVSIANQDFCGYKHVLLFDVICYTIYRTMTSLCKEVALHKAISMLSCYCTMTFVYIDSSLKEYLIYTMLTVCRDAGTALRRLAGHVWPGPHPATVEVPGQRGLPGREYPPTPRLSARTLWCGE